MASVGEESCSLMLSSPPKAARGSRPFRYGGGGQTASRLFADDDDDDENPDEPENRPPNKNLPFARYHVASKAARSAAVGGGGSHHHGSGRPQVRPLDLNFELSAADETSPSESKESVAARSGMTKHHRKRQADQALTAGRDMSFDEDDSEVNLSADDMYTSPVSPHPSVYKSPSSFRTLDGRTVQSKNPFSPMLMEDTTPAATSTGTTNSSAGTPARGYPTGRQHHHTASIADSLGFPVSLEPGNSPKNIPNGGNNIKDGSPLGPPVLRHKLHKRETVLDSPTVRSESYDYSSFTRDGYPNRTGRFSFTGSPIKEIEICGDNVPSDAAAAPPSPPKSVHKVRRYNRGDDVVAASHHDEHHHYHHNWRSANLHVDTKHGHRPASGKGVGDEEISPTDVMSFPPLPSSPPRADARPPPTPTKQPKSSISSTFYRRRTYTPIHKPDRPPGTPERFRRVRSFDDLEFGDDTECSDSEQGGDDLMLLAQHSNRRRPVRRETVSRFYSDFDIIGELGKGTFGSVFKVLSRLDGCMYAVKAAHRPAKGNADKDRMLKEVCRRFLARMLKSSHRAPSSHHVSFVIFIHYRFTPWQHCQTKQILPHSTLSDTIKRGWRKIDFTFKRSFAPRRYLMRFNVTMFSPSTGGGSFLEKFFSRWNLVSLMNWMFSICVPPFSLV